MKQSVAVAFQTTLKSIFVNVVLAAVKILAGLLGHSYALIADGIESLTDVVTSSVVLVSLRISSRPPDEDHPFGHGKAEQLGALFSALALLAAGAIIAIQSSRNLVGRHSSPDWFTLPILLLVVVTKMILSRYALKKSAETTSIALKGDAWHHRSDAITSALAFLGITISLAGGPGYEKADDIAALLGCLVIGYNGFSLLKLALHENMDGAAPPEMVREVLALAESTEGVRRIEKLRMKKSGLGYHMDVHVQVDRRITVEKGHAIGHRVKDAVRASFPAVTDIVTHVEPFSGPTVPHEAPDREPSRGK
ncbi:MAG: cation transporter [Opitutaceae bacterium]|nr:cation transporter [Opitutaceae bacterium]